MPTSWWWVTLPRALARRSVAASAVAADGHFLAGLGLAPLALAAGVVVGALHPGFDEAFTESLPVMVAALVVGTVSGQLGALAVVGYAVGDFFVTHTAWTTRPTVTEPSSPLFDNPLVANLVVDRVPLLIQYGLLATLVVGVPLGARTLAASLALRLRLPDGAHLAVSAVIVAVTAYVLARFWASAAPLIIRPVFTWTIDDGINRGSPPAGAIVPVQSNAVWIARTAALAVFGRAALVWALSAVRRNRLEPLEAALLRPLDVPKARRGPLVELLGAAATAGCAVLFLAGMISDLWVAGVLGGVFLVARLVGSGWIPVPTRRWREVMDHIPLIVRVGAMLLVLNGIAKAVADSSYTSETTFHFLLWPIAGAALLMAILVPETPPVDAADLADEESRS